MQCDFLNKGKKGGELMLHSMMSSVALKHLRTFFLIVTVYACTLFCLGYMGYDAVGLPMLSLCYLEMYSQCKCIITITLIHPSPYR